MSASPQQRWEVIGGADIGGIVVREGLELSSPAQAERLSTGATVAQDELVGNRLRYRKLTGTGPDRGWVSTVLKEKTLLVRLSEDQSAGYEKSSASGDTAAVVEDAHEAAEVDDKAGKAGLEDEVAVTAAAPDDALADDAPKKDEAQLVFVCTPIPKAKIKKRKAKAKRTLGEKLALAKTLQQTASVLLKERSIEETDSLVDLARHLQDTAFELLVAEKAARSSDGGRATGQRESEAEIDAEADAEVDGLNVEQKTEERVPEAEERSPEAEGGQALEGSAEQTDAPKEQEDEGEEDDEEDQEDEEEEEQDRSKMKCATWGCIYRVHSKAVFGSYCCIACYETRGMFGHGAQCERIEMPQEKSDKMEDEIVKLEKDVSDAKDTEVIKKVDDSAKPAPKQESKEEKEAKAVIEEAKRLAKKMQDNAAALLKDDAEEPEAEQAAKSDSDAKDESKLKQEDKIALAKTLQDTAALLLKDGVIEKAEKLAKRLQDMAFALLKEDVKAEQEDALNKDPKERKYADSVLKEDTKKSLEEWRKDISKSRRSGNPDLVIKTLQDGSEALLKDGIAFEEAMRWAKEAEEAYRKIGSRWRLGVVLDIIAKLHLKIVDGIGDAGAEGEDATAKRRKKEHIDEALKIISEAVTLLKKIGHSREEESLASARGTLAEVRSKVEADEASAKAKPKGKARTKATEKDEAKVAQEAVAEKRRLYRMAPDGRGDHAGFASALKNAALVLLKVGEAQEAGQLAEEAAGLYRKLGAAKELGIALDVAGKAYVRKVLDALEAAGASNASLLRDRQFLLKAKTTSTEAVALLTKGSTLEWISPLASAQCTLLRVRGLERSSTGDAPREIQDKSGSPLTLERGFGYAAGLEKPSTFARFDIREDVCRSVGGFTHGQVVRDQDRNKYVVIGVKAGNEVPWQRQQLWFQPKSILRPASCCFPGLSVSDLTALLTPIDTEELQQVKAEDLDADEDSDGESIALCHECLLPLGATKYASKNGDGFLHGECCAKILLDNSKDEDDKWNAEANRKKMRDRVEYNIGWRPERMIPRNDEFLRERRVPTPEGAKTDSMYCLILEGGATPRVRLVPTKDPESALVLEYLALALQVRIKANMAPYFSLDTPKADEQWQMKVFGPPWLKGTSVGEVLFQSDYHLKELSMGDSLFEQPIVGMKSCWDYDWGEEGWRGREWFVVRDAKVTVSENNVLIPHVRMGVEARATERTEKNTLRDVAVTSKAHPLVKFADQFSHFFELVAERKGVIFCLRQVSQAAIVAKFLVDNKVALDDFWLKANDKSDVCKLDLPFNKENRSTYEILVCDGAIKEVMGGVQVSTTGMSGGVDLNIDSFDLTMPLRLSKSIQAPNYAAIYGDPEMSGGSSKDLGKLSQRDLRKLIQQAGGEAPHGPADKPDLIEILTALRPEAAGEVGDDAKDEEDERLAFLPELEQDLRKILRSEETLREVMTAIRERAKAGSEPELPAEQKGFWESLNEDTEEAKLLKSVYASRFCDRRQEKALFIPPVSNERYRNALKALVEEERDMQEKRRTHFLSNDFVPTAPGPLFPTSWKNWFNVHSGRGSSVAAGGDKKGRSKQLVESQADGAQIMKETKAVFDRSTEDGSRYRIYSRGLLEVRTTQTGEEGEETIGVVFEVQAGMPPPDVHPIMKVTIFVRSTKDAPLPAGQPEPSRPYSYFVVFETDLGDVLVLEKVVGGKATLDENPGDIEERYSRARVLNAADCSGTGTTVQDVREHHASVAKNAKLSARKFTQGVFDWAGGTPLVQTGANGVLQVPGTLARAEAPPVAPSPAPAPAPAPAQWRPQQTFPGGRPPGSKPGPPNRPKAIFPGQFHGRR